MIDRRQRFGIDGHKPAKQSPEDRIRNFNEVYQGYTPEQAMEQAQRCMYCEHGPCSHACPLHNDIPAALFCMAQGDFAGAAMKFMETSNFPDVCGRICPQEKQCEGQCVLLGSKDRIAVCIGKLEAFALDYVRKNGGYPMREKAPATGMKVAIVGAGPAGLAVAEELTVKGHECTCFDMWPTPGGLMLYGIPNFKLNKEIILTKAEYLRELGVKFVGSYRVGKDRPVDEFLKRGFDLVFLGYGAIKGTVMKIPGEDTLKNIYSATEYLVRGNIPRHLLPEEWAAEPDPRPHHTGRTLVVGGGDTACDCLRTARRLNRDAETICLYRRSEREMPGRIEERIHALEEGAKIEYLSAPVRFIGNERGEVCAAECIRMRLGEPDAKGRRSPVPIEGSNYIMECDTVALAIGYSPETEIPESTNNLKTTNWGSVWVQTEENGRTSRQEIWAAGDNVHGADLVVTAVAAARRAADDMHATLMDLKRRREAILKVRPMPQPPAFRSAA
jgi:glutamate synthase (NADPH/NADH) small chain